MKYSFNNHRMHKIIEKISRIKINRILVVFIFLIISILFISSALNKSMNIKSKSSTDKNAEEFNNYKNNEIIEQAILEEKRAKEEEEIKRKYQPLTEEEISKVDHIYSYSEPKRVFLTFDDGPTKQVTPYILDLLQQENIKANFFVIGSRVKENPELVNREFNEGHFIGNHGYSHNYSLIYQSTEALFSEFGETNRLIRNAIGNNNFNTLVFRFPGGLAGGKYNDMKKEIAEKLKENGVANVDWNALTNDAAGAKTKEALLNSFYETTKDKTSIVLLMHDAADKILTYEVLPEIISYFRENDYEFKTISDIIGR